MAYETFGQRLKKSREYRGLTQLELAKQSRVAEGTISCYERDKKAPAYWMLVELATRLEVSLDYLCGMTKEFKSIPRLVNPSPIQTQALIPVADSWRATLYDQED